MNRHLTEKKALEMFGVIRYSGNANLKCDHLPPVRTDKMKTVTWPCDDEDGKKPNYTQVLLVRMQNGTATLETVAQFIINIWAATAILCIYLRKKGENKTLYECSQQL